MTVRQAETALSQTQSWGYSVGGDHNCGSKMTGWPSGVTDGAVAGIVTVRPADWTVSRRGLRPGRRRTWRYRDDEVAGAHGVREGAGRARRPATPLVMFSSSRAVGGSARAPRSNRVVWLLRRCPAKVSCEAGCLEPSLVLFLI